MNTYNNIKQRLHNFFGVVHVLLKHSTQQKKLAVENEEWDRVCYFDTYMRAVQDVLDIFTKFFKEAQMSTEKFKKQFALFHAWIDYAMQVRNLASIVQNDLSNYPVKEADFKTWQKEVESFRGRFDHLVEETVELFEKDKTALLK